MFWYAFAAWWLASGLCTYWHVDKFHVDNSKTLESLKEYLSLRPVYAILALATGPLAWVLSCFMSIKASWKARNKEKQGKEK